MAGLIPQSFIDDLLHRTDIVEVIDKRVSLKKQGNNHTACCPFHEEKTPSFSVNQDRQFYYCFGCGAGGNAIGFIMNFDQASFPQAVENLAKDTGLEIPYQESEAQAKKNSQNGLLIEALESANKFYQSQIRHHNNKAAPINYLKGRGLTGKIAQEFGLGYAPPGWANLLTSIGTDGKKQRILLKAGLIIEKPQNKTQTKNQSQAAEQQYYDRFRDRIMFPIRDSRGRTVAFGGRVLSDEKPKYLNSPETPVFRKGSELYGLYESKKSGEKHDKLILVEGYMDVIALAQMEIRNAVATLGTATNSTHLTRMFRQVPEVIFCFDGDKAGNAAAWRALENTLPLMEDGRQVKFLFLPAGADPDTHVRSIGKEAFLGEVNSATPLEDFFFNKLTQDLDIGSIEGKARLSNLAKKYIQKIPTGIYAKLMLNRLADLLGVSVDSLDQLFNGTPLLDSTRSNSVLESLNDKNIINNLSSAGGNRQGFIGKAEELKGYRKPASLKAIELLLRNPEIALSITKDLKPLHAAEDEGRKLLVALIEMVRNNPKTDTFSMLGYCYATKLGGRLTKLLDSEKITPVEGLEKEFLQIIDNILSDVTQKLELVRLKTELRQKVYPHSRNSI